LALKKCWKRDGYEIHRDVVNGIEKVGIKKKKFIRSERVFILLSPSLPYTTGFLETS